MPTSFDLFFDADEYVIRPVIDRCHEYFAHDMTRENVLVVTSWRTISVLDNFLNGSK